MQQGVLATPLQVSWQVTTYFFTDVRQNTQFPNWLMFGAHSPVLLGNKNSCSVGKHFCTFFCFIDVKVTLLF